MSSLVPKHSGAQRASCLFGVVKASLTTTATGGLVQAGLESYYQTAFVQDYVMSSLQYQKNGGAATSWSGRDGTLVNAPLCGRWISDTSREVGQGAGQC